MIRGFAPEHGPPSGSQSRKIEIAQARDLVLKFVSLNQHLTATHRERRADFFAAAFRASAVTIL
jgi:hypothetical protein